MKKLVLTLALTTLLFVSCNQKGNLTNTEDPADTTSVDTTAVDSTATDTTAVDTTATDSVTNK